MGLARLLTPDIYLDSIFDLDLKALGGRGIKGIIVDLDNTLVRWDHPQPTRRLRAWLEGVRATGMQVCIVSNNSRGRVQSFARSLDVPGIHKAIKPRRGSFRRAMSLMGTSPSETAVMGDQVFTDILGGNRLGLLTALVIPVSRREFVGTRLVRMFEGAWIGYLIRRGRLDPPAGNRDGAGES